MRTALRHTDSSLLNSTNTFTPSMRRMRTRLPAGMGVPSSLRADQATPPMITAPLPWILSMFSVTCASVPRIRSALVGWTLLLINFLARGRTASRHSTLTTKNSPIWSQIGPPSRAQTNAARAPAANQIDVKPTVRASPKEKSNSRTSQAISKMSFMVYPPFFLYCIITAGTVP